MANRGTSKHLKRFVLPAYIKIRRKEKKYILKPLPGPHPKDDSLALGVLLRDYMKLANNMREVKYILNNRKLMVDGRVIREPKFPVGYQDIIDIKDVGRFIIDIDERGYFVAKEYRENTQILKVTNKTKVAGGKIQYTFHNGRTLISDDNSIKIGDSVMFDITSKKIVRIIGQGKGKECIVLRGKHRGFRGKIKDVLDIGKKVADVISPRGEVVRTDYKYLFVTG
ncbi:MAG: KOW motif-containing protein [Candidatus Micrarchaeota archaeon]|nr:KOW motif-containing protein [Candidatus Micrarchaeota archaeon]MCX8154690.1 KOW motif-containing protein [Candidatus Micrarchaeota archaeon]